MIKLLMRATVALLSVFAALAAFSAPLASRTYWVVDLATYATKGTAHTHIEVAGFVTYTAREDDGDLHIRLCDSVSVVGMDAARCVVAECIPALPCARPAMGARVRIRGISRRDAEHGWREVHPVELLTVLS